MADSFNEEKVNKKISEISSTLNVSEDKIKKLWGKMSEEEIIELFKDLSAKKEVKETYEVKEEKKEETKEEKFIPAYKRKSLVERLSETEEE